MRYCLTLLLPIALAITLLAQTTESDIATNSTTLASPQTIDGRTHPEQIPDLAACRLFFISAAAPLEGATVEEKAAQDNLLTPINLSNNDLELTIRVLAEFRSSYETLISTYNRSAAAALANGTQPDTRSFLKMRDALVQDTRNTLASVLTPDGLAALNAHIKAEKKNMQVAVEEDAQ